MRFQTSRLSHGWPSSHIVMHPRGISSRVAAAAAASHSFPSHAQCRPRRLHVSTRGGVIFHSSRSFLTTSDVSLRLGGFGRGEAEGTARRWQSSGGAEAELREIEDSIAAVRAAALRHCDDVFHFLPTVDYRHSMVMLLGNHSAGKSTAINYLLGRAVQRTGVAPTDDGFTIIQRGERDEEEDGPTSLSDPRYQLQDLQKFGMHFVHRFKMKTRRLPASSRVPHGLMIVDTPGMIDTPTHVKDRTSLEGQLRGYDFLAATRWFASRCDVILLLFDPANPGTTGETLDVLTKSLAGFEHKFLLVMNKVDMFDRATDFGRAYGALCWNLSKVMTMKDIPRIYTTFIPVKNAATDEMEATPTPTSTTPTTPLSSSASTTTTTTAARPQQKPTEKIKSLTTTTASSDIFSGDERVGVVAMEEFLRERDELMEELLKAPLRRLDNLVTEAEEGTRRALLAGRVCTAIVWRYRQEQVTAVLAPSALLGVAVFCLSFGGFSGISMSFAALSTFAAALTLCGYMNRLKRLEKELLENSDAIIDRLFIGREKSLDLQLRWQNTVRPEVLALAVSSAEAGKGIIASLPTLSPWAQKSLTSILKNDIPNLRLRVAEYKKTHHSLRHTPPTDSNRH